MKPADTIVGSEGDVGEQHPYLKISVARHVEVEIVEVQPEVVAPDIGEELAQSRRLCSILAVFADHEFLAEGGFDPLVPKLEAGQPEPARARMPVPKTDHKIAIQTSAKATSPKTGISLMWARQPPQYRQEGDQRHHRVDQARAKRFHDCGEAHRVFLDALRSAFDMAHPLPEIDIPVIHGRAPAEDVVAGEEALSTAVVMNTIAMVRKVASCA